jgi:hypothetical protein
MSVGDEIVGGLVSCTRTMKPPWTVMPDAPVAEQLTTVTPTGNVLPEIGVQVTVGLTGFVSLAVTV